MQNWDIVLLTEDRYYEPVSITPYIQNILDDDRLLMAALAAENFKVVRKSWSDPDFDWSTTKFCISEPPGIILTDLKHFLIGLTLQQKNTFHKFRIADSLEFG